MVTLWLNRSPAATIAKRKELHMRMVFSAAEKAGWLAEGQKRLDFMGFGLVQGQDGPATVQKGKREKANYHFRKSN